MRKLAPNELAAIKERRVQARANSAIEGVALTAAQESLFEQFDSEALPHDERRRRLILRLTPIKLASAE